MSLLDATLEKLMYVYVTDSTDFTRISVNKSITESVFDHSYVKLDFAVRIKSIIVLA